MCQTIKQHKRLIRGNKAMTKPMAISNFEEEMAELQRIRRIFWTAVAIFYLVIIGVLML